MEHSPFVQSIKPRLTRFARVVTEGLRLPGIPENQVSQTQRKSKKCLEYFDRLILFSHRELIRRCDFDV